MSASTSQAVFKFGDGTTLSIDPNLAKLSSFFDEKQKAGVNKFELSEAFIGEAFNTFCEKFFAKYATQLKKLEDAADKEDWWMEFIAEHAELADSVKDLFRDDLIRVGNAAAEWNFPALVHSCAWIMSSQTENMKLTDLREYLNEEYDFPDEIKRKIEACPEFVEL